MLQALGLMIRMLTYHKLLFHHSSSSRYFYFRTFI
nr:MAG TPA: hypothetical protein [Caudoviricetes sp.]